MMEAVDHANGSAAQGKVAEQGHEHAHEHGHDGMCEHHHMQPFDLTIFVPKADFIAISKQPPQQQIPQARTGAVSLPDSLDGYVQLFLPASNLDVLRDIKQSVADSAEGFWIGAHSFQRVPLVEEEQDQQQQESQEPRFALDGKASEIFPDTANLGSIFDGEYYKDPNARRALRAVPIPYSDSEARAHILRVRDASLSFTPALHSRRVYQPPPYDPNALVIDGGLSVFPALRSTVAEDRPEVMVNGHSPEAYSNGNTEEGKSAKKTKGKGKQKPQESQSNSQLAAGPEKKAVDIASFSASFLEEDFDPLAMHFERQRLLPKTSLPPPAFKNLQLSAWNPAPPHLRLRGHYMYLSVATLEGENVHITVAREGFFVNKSDNHHFDPSPRTQVSKTKPQAHITHHTLFGLLAAISPQFAERTAPLFVDVSQSATDLFASLAITNCPPAAPWLVSKPEVVADGARSQIAYLVTGSTDADYLPSSKDWNEELTSMRDLPKESNDERIIRDRYASRLYADFQTAAARGVISIERGDIPPLNSLDANESDSYLAYNILFTQAQDSADTYKHLGGDEAARATASKDVWATKLLSDADVQGLNTIATAIIDYCGKRWIAQAIPPGIFNKGPEETVVNDAPQAEADSTEAASAETQKEKAQAGGLRAVYGPVNTDKPYERYIADPSFEPLAKKVAEQFHLAKHAVTDSKGRKIEMWTPADVHGLVGADGRMYAIDLFRLSPVDVTFLEEDMTKLYGSDTSTEAAKEDAYPHRITLLRPELVELFHATKTREWIEQQVKEKTSKEEEGKAVISSAKDADADESLEKPESATSEDFVKVESEPTPEVANQETDGIQELKEKEQTVINVADFNLAFNPDAFVDRADLPYQHWKDSVSHEDDATKAVREASMHLRSTAIPALLRDIIAEETLPLDSCDLSQMLHRRGINIRYLGYIAEQCKQAPSAPNGIVRAPEAEQEVIAFLSKFRASLIGDMVLRGAKHVLRSLIAGLPLVEATEAVAHFLNCFVGKPSVQDSRPVNTTGSTAAWTQLSHELLCQQIGQQVRMRFRFVLPAASIEGFTTKAQLLREICLVSGIQLVLQHYDLLGGQSNDCAAPPASDSKKKAGGKHANGASSPGTSPTFSPDDILNIYPVVKKAPFKSTMAEETLERGQVHYLRGNPALGEVFVNDALTMYDQIYGPVHPEMAESYRLVGNLYHRLTGPLLRRIQLYEQIGALQREEDRERIRKETGFESEEAFEEAKFQHEFYLQQAVKLTRQAVVISERCNGLDAAETLHCYSELAIFEHSAGNVELALKLLQHTASISNAVYGDCHPEKARAASFAATMMKSARPDNALAAIPFFKSAQTLANKAYGPNSIISANSAYQVAQCYIVNSQLAQSVPYIEQAANIYELRMGKDSDSAREAQQLLSVVRSAVDQKEKGELEKVEKLAKRLGADPARAKELISKMQTGTGVSRSSRSSFQQAASDAVSASNGTVKRSKDSTGSRGHLDVDDLVLYIEGGPKKSSEASKKGKGKKASKA